ncbi:Uncharacterised protein [Corynebacterium striatum]|nr:Uncharacterised protein [Corynebacterium striatum]
MAKPLPCWVSFALGVLAGLAPLAQALARNLFHQLGAGLAQFHAQVPGLVMVANLGHERLNLPQRNQPMAAAARRCYRRALLLGGVRGPEVGVMEGEELGGVGRRGS